MKPYLIVLADDHVLFRRGLKKIIEEVDGLQVVGEANDGLELLTLLRKIKPNLVIIDIAMPNLRGLEAAREIKKLYPQVKVLILTMHKKTIFLKESLEAGVDGFLVKEVADTELVEAIQAIRGQHKVFSPQLSEKLANLAILGGAEDPLTKREKEVAKLLAEGKSGREIAELLYISKFTVRRHRDRIMRKLGLKSLADLVRYALSQGYTFHDS